MMSRYANVDGFITERYSPSNSPRGRRYILTNLNTKKLKQTSESPLIKQKSHKTINEYYDINKAPLSQRSESVKAKPIGTANKVMPTETSSKGSTPRKTPREPPIYVGPRRKAQAKNAVPINKTQEQNKKKITQSNNHTDTKKELAPNKMNEKGLTPRDEYMVTKLYDNQIIYVKPSEVRYTHDQISAHFTDGRSMLSTFIDLLYGRVEIRLGGNDVPPIEVMQTDINEFGKEAKLWFVLNGNRRLYVFRKLEKCGALKTMQVIARKYDSIDMDKQFLTRNNGRSVSVVNDAGLNDKISKELKRWKEWTAKQPEQKAGEKSGSKPGEKKDVAKNDNIAKANKSSFCVIT